MKVYVSLLFCLLFAGISAVYGQQVNQQIESQIIALAHKYWDAWKNKDAKTLAQLRSDDFQEADQDGVWDKKQAEQGEIDMEITSYKLWNEKVSILQPGVALLPSEAAYTSSYKGADDSSPHSYIAWLFVLRDGNWRVLYSQDSVAKVSSEKPSSAESTPSKPDSFFIDKEKEVWEALKHKDKAAATRLLADDFVGMYDFGFFNKSEWIKQIDDQYTVDDYTIMNPEVLHPSPNTALLLYTSTCKGTGAWADFCSHSSRISDLMVDRNGEWLALFSQDTTATADEQSDDAVMKAIVANEQQIFETLKRNDIVAFGNMLPEDVIMVEDDGIETKAVWLKEFEEQKKTGLLFKDFKMDDIRLIRYSPSAATLVFKETIDGSQDGKPFEWHINTSSGYVNRDGKWVPILYQDTMAK